MTEVQVQILRKLLQEPNNAYTGRDLFAKIFTKGRRHYPAFLSEIQPLVRLKYVDFSASGYRISSYALFLHEEGILT